MARIRTVKPEFWTDESIGECSPSARLLFLGALNFSDDHGGLDRSAKQLKAQVFPYDALDCEPLIQELLTHGLWVEYESSGKKYLHIKGFREHQKIDKPSANRVPLYDDSLSIPRALSEPSPSPRPSSLGREGNGKEGNGSIHVPQERDGPVERIFAHWRTEYRHPRAVLDPKRRKVIQAALKAYDESTVCASISGYRLSPHHMGQNEQRTIYDDISLFLRDTEHIERGLGFSRAVEPAKSRIQQIQERLRGKCDERVVSEQDGSGAAGLVPANGLLR